MANFTNMKKVLDLIIEFGNVYPNVAEAESSIAKAIALSPVVNELTGILTVDMAALSAEYSAMVEADKVELLAYAKDKYDIDDDKLEAQVERGFVLAFDVWRIGRDIVAYAKECKK